MTLLEAVQKIEKVLYPKKVTMIECKDTRGYQFDFQMNYEKRTCFVDFECPDDKILNFIENNEDCYVTYREIKNETKLDDKTIRKSLNNLINLNFVTKFSENKQGVWCHYCSN